MTLTELQNRLETLVKSAPLLNGRPVLIEDKGNLVSQVETALQTQSLAAVIALAAGETNSSALRGRAAWKETFEVVIHRGLLDAEDVPATLAVLDQLRLLLHGAQLDAATPTKGFFACTRHDLRDGGDGTYARVLNVTTTTPISISDAEALTLGGVGLTLAGDPVTI